MPRNSGSKGRSAAALEDLRGLRRIARSFGPEHASAKLELLERLEHARLPSAEAVSELHEVACFLRAYPDSPALLRCVGRILDGFAARPDLKRHRDALASSGIAGTDMHFAFYWFTTSRLAKRWPHRLSVEWELFEHEAELRELLPLLLEEHEAMAAEESDLELRDLVDGFKRPDETDAAFLVRSFRHLRADPLLREKLFDDLVLPLILAAGPDTPSRTRALFPKRRVAYRTTPVPRAPKPSKRAFTESPRSVRRPSPKDAELLVRLARESMMTRLRDLYAFCHADADDVVRVDYGAGLEFACIGMTPERRGLLYGMFVILALQNGVPIGYVQASTLFESAEVNFNVFDSFRGAEASRVFVASLAMMHHLFGARTFAINTQQLGEENDEALATGAWWFYHKHGFRPDGAAIRRLADRELRAKKRDPAHRSSLETLRELASEPLYLSLAGRRADAIGRLDVGRVGATAGRRLSALRRDRKSEGRWESEAEALLGVSSTESWSRGERLAWKRWSPLALALPGVARWPAPERRALARVMRAKGGRREAEFVRRFDEHVPLRRAVVRMARASGP